MAKVGGMAKENPKPLNQQQTAREKRLKEALRVNLQRRRQKAHAHRSDDLNDENSSKVSDIDNSEQN